MSIDFFHAAIQPTLFDEEDLPIAPVLPDPELPPVPFLMQDTYLGFFVPGKPAPQGSKTTYGGRPTKSGGISKPHTTEANPRTRPWRADVREAATAARIDQGWDTATGPVEVRLTFYKPRPLGHYGTGKNSEVLKPGAPYYVLTGPDIDKLSRAVLDAMTNALVYRDDKQVVVLSAQHLYVERRTWQGGVFVQVEPLEHPYLAHPSSASRA